MAIQLPELRRLAVPSVCFLICFLAYSSQWLFYHIEPGPLSRKEALVFNALVCCTWWSYAQACLRDPGRLPEKVADVGVETVQDGSGNGDTTGRGEQVYNSRWCKKCKAVKPPRAHHCRQCGR
jgi:palmitoyltransferase